MTKLGTEGLPVLKDFGYKKAEYNMTKFDDFLYLDKLVDKAAKGAISLPTVQRGFVWKPHQIENLWDSLLRGYPVGAFVITQKDGSDENYELLDGQQRATSICLGFYNPLKDSDDFNKIFKTSTASYNIFIDLAKPKEDDSRKFIFRVITKSHPWGYRRQENQKTLTAESITRAIRTYGLSNRYDYLQEPLNNFWPFDSYKPIPIGIFISAAIQNKPIEEVEEAIEKWKRDKNIPTKDDIADYYSLKYVYDEVNTMLTNTRIPVLTLNLEQIYYSEDNVSKTINSNSETNAVFVPDAVSNEDDQEENEQGNIEDHRRDEVENLFIRLNSAGTPLGGDELNYSVLKANIDATLQASIEKACEDFIKPARFVAIAFRLYKLHKRSVIALEQDSISMSIKPKQFQRAIKIEKSKFSGFIRDQLIDNGLLERSKSILTYHNEKNLIGLPSFIVNKLADQAPEIMFMLLYRLLIKQDQINDDLKPKVLGMITLFAWLGKGEKQRDHNKLLQLIWPCVSKFKEPERFWSQETIQRAMITDFNNYEILTCFPNSRDLTKLVPSRALLCPTF